MLFPVDNSVVPDDARFVDVLSEETVFTQVCVVVTVMRTVVSSSHTYISIEAQSRFDANDGFS